MVDINANQGLHFTHQPRAPGADPSQPAEIAADTRHQAALGPASVVSPAPVKREQVR